MSKGYVYVLTNPSMPGIVKIGQTKRTAEARAAELWQTGVPTPFIVHFSIKTPDCGRLESLCHEKLFDFRVENSREFFRVLPDFAKKAVSEMADEVFDEWRDEFKPEFALVPYEAMIDPADVYMIAEKLGEPIEVVALCFDMIEIQHIRDAVNKFYAKQTKIVNVGGGDE